ncbi:peptide/nickel transport system ATP-binding protein/oligopeptide transport system ATP-binding protein [Salana multivorans]|uniref:Peptide/nickel transport system ATP-binding protein/oligopeptide transport system ATP-binding protein n=1 Tax=Salana multivorans TaxID=120377 RepID=A0A3N2DDD6_9MICO|nr:ATP-binding cassette domain-containing protein [Salana multivorans]ROR97752.1 peptide/nickel transport system ATP-binding protein/oligopeptide transport system ATP-binding protein [Salana multivorans]
MTVMLEARDLCKTFVGRGGSRVDAVRNVHLRLEAGQSMGLVGESGSGKSTVGRLCLGLLEPTSGSIVFEGRDLTSVSAAEMRRLRSRLQVVFQEPFESLNPRMRVGDVVGEPLVLHGGGRPARVREKVLAMLEQVGLRKELADDYPGDMSGGQQQRVGIARAFITDPTLVVLDEPTSSLDVSVRSQILRLLERLQEERRTAYLFISHDIHTIEYLCSDVVVMQNGAIVESGPVEQVLRAPETAYTQRLMGSRLSFDPPEPGRRTR